MGVRRADDEVVAGGAHDAASAISGRTAKRETARWKVGGATIISFVALLYVAELVDQLDGHALDRNGIRPLETDGLWALSSRRCCTPTGRI
ncbi:integral membrane domain protein [Mycobacterium xenopi 3993]|nr:integral membrane domain protein [Mycobacterium xenopi 3993]